jgi:hypothetical protein
LHGRGPTVYPSAFPERQKPVRPFFGAIPVSFRKSLNAEVAAALDEQVRIEASAAEAGEVAESFAELLEQINAESKA